MTTIILAVVFADVGHKRQPKELKLLFIPFLFVPFTNHSFGKTIESSIR